jgi:catechol 2,3-dioxygenase-like lactoylglutathione lyase family enzyme
VLASGGTVLGMPINEWDHYTVRSKDVAASWAFYEQALGLNVRKRQGFSVPAFIVSIGNREVVHVFQASPEMEAVFARMPSAREVEGWTTGRLHHVEFWATDLNAVRARLAGQGVEVAEKTLPDKHQLHMCDPDGIQVNLNFPLSEVKRE